MNLLLDKLSTILQQRIGNIEFNTDFRTGILFEMLMQDKNLKKEAKVIQGVKKKSSKNNKKIKYTITTTTTDTFIVLLFNSITSIYKK